MFEKVQHGDSFLISPEILKLECSPSHGARWATCELWLTTHHRSESDLPQQVSSAFYGKKLWGASAAPHVLGRLSALKGMGEKWRGMVLSWAFLASS